MDTVNEPYRHALRGRNVLITGGLGFIGSNLAHRILEIGGVKVTILDSLAPGQGGNLYNLHSVLNEIDLHLGDMGCEDVINPLLSGIDYIFNLAGATGHMDSMTNPHQDLASNCGAQLALLEGCRNFNPRAKIIFTSTRQVYGKPDYLPVDEQHVIAPLDINGVNKFAAENYHQIYHRIHGLRTVCLRLTNTYGPRQQLAHNRQGFIPWFVRTAIEGGTIQLFGGGKQRRDLNFVEDAVEALLLVACSPETDGEVFNLGSAPTTLEQVASELISITGSGRVEPVPFPPDRQTIEIGNVYSDFGKIRSKLGWEPYTDLHAGLSRTVEFYLQNREHYWNEPEVSLSRSHKTA